MSQFYKIFISDNNISDRVYRLFKVITITKEHKYLVIVIKRTRIINTKYKVRLQLTKLNITPQLIHQIDTKCISQKTIYSTTTTLRNKLLKVVSKDLL